MASLTAVSSQEITVNCTFALSISGDYYYCILEDIVVTDPAANVTFGGLHIGDKTNNDVDTIVIVNSTTPFMIPEMFTTFPNVDDLTIENSNLESIEIPEFIQLNWLDIYLNNVTTISSNSFRNQSNLFFLFLDSNNIESIDADAFDWIGSGAFYLSLYRNNIRNLASTTFHSLTDLFLLDLEGNLLESIDDELFSRNEELVVLYLESNEINEVSPTFAANLRQSLSFLAMSNNTCVDDDFDLQSDASWMKFNNAMFTCFNNFVNGSTDGSRNLAMHYQGPLRLFDEFGHIIAVV